MTGGESRAEPSRGYVRTPAMKRLGYFLSKAMKHYRAFYLPSLGSNTEATWLTVTLVAANGESGLFGQ